MGARGVERGRRDLSGRGAAGGPGRQRARLKPSGYGRGGQFLLANWGVSGIGKVRKALGANVHSFRKKAGLSQERLAEKSELHPVYISQVERREQAVSVEALWKLSRALRVSLSALFRGM